MRKTTGKAGRNKVVASLYPTGYTTSMTTATRFAVLFSLVNEKSTVHAADCRMVKAAQSTRSHCIAFVVADSANDAAAQYDAKTAEQGLRKATICKCAT